MVRFLGLLLKILPFVGAALILAAVAISLLGHEMGQGALVLVGLGFALLLAMFLKFEAASLRYYLSLVILAVLMLGNATFLYLLSLNHPLEWDLTRGARYSLSPQTRRILESLKKNVAITVWSTQNEPYAGYLERYTALCGRLTYSIKSPYQKMRASEGKPGEQSAMNTIDVKCGDRKETISLSEMGPEELQRVDRNLEKLLVSAILSVVRDRKSSLYFVTGHGEKQMQPQTGGQGEARSILNFGLLLDKSGMDVRAGQDLKTERLVPEDCDLLVLAGPQLDCAPSEIDAIRAYLDKGGRLLVLIDPPVHERILRSRLCALLNDYGIRVSEEILADCGSYAAEQNDYFTPLVRAFNAANPISEPLTLEGKPLPLTLCCAVEKRADAPADLAVSELLFSSEQSWTVSLGAYEQAAMQGGNVSIPPRTQWRKHALAAAAEVKAPAGDSARAAESKPRPRIVVVGDSDFLANTQLGGMQAQLGYSIVTWLTGKTGNIETLPQDAAVTHVVLNTRQRNLVLILSVVVLPFAVFFGGLAYTTVRRRRR